jgi:flagellar biosynthesis/type III secretory pathway protein FliH
MPKLSTTTTVETAIEIAPELKVILDEQCELHTTLSAQIKELESQKSDAASAIEAIREEIGAKELNLDTGYKVTLVEGETPGKLDVQMLLKNGVKMSVIEKSYTAPTPKKPYTLVTPPRPKGKKK